MGNLLTPNSVQKLQKALHAKAKAEPGYRFYALYDKIGREDILAHAYAQCRSNKGAPGMDGQDFEAVRRTGFEQWLGELALALRRETYRPDPIRRVYIPKANGKLGPLGISTLWDRVCMTAAMLVMEPIFEADNYRNSTPTVPSETLNGRGRGGRAAVPVAIRKLWTPTSRTKQGYSPCELLKSVARRIVDRRVLHLIRMWLDCPVEETDDEDGGHARPRRETSGAASRKARAHLTLAGEIFNMRRFVLGWKMFGLSERTLGPRLVTYADDLVILCRRGQGRSGLAETAGDHGQAEADGERGEDAHLQSAGRRVRLSGIHVRANVFGEDRPSSYRLPAVKKSIQRARSRRSTR